MTNLQFETDSKSYNRDHPHREHMTERDLLKVCMDKPYYLSKVLGHDEASTGLETQAQKMEFLRYMYRAWSGMTKYLS